MIGVFSVAVAWTVVFKMPPFSTVCVAFPKKYVSGLQCSQIDMDTYKSSDNPREAFVRVVDMLVGYTRFGSTGDSPVTSVPSEYPT